MINLQNARIKSRACNTVNGAVLRDQQVSELFWKGRTSADAPRNDVFGTSKDIDGHAPPGLFGANHLSTNWDTKIPYVADHARRMLVS